MSNSKRKRRKLTSGLQKISGQILEQIASAAVKHLGQKRAYFVLLGDEIHHLTVLEMAQNTNIYPKTLVRKHMKDEWQTLESLGQLWKQVQRQRRTTQKPRSILDRPDGLKQWSLDSASHSQTALCLALPGSWKRAGGPKDLFLVILLLLCVGFLFSKYFS